MQSPSSERGRVAQIIKRLVVRDSRLTIDINLVNEEEPLNGELLKINSLGLVTMLLHIEDELGTNLPDSLFVGRSFEKVSDLIDVVADHCRSCVQ